MEELEQLLSDKANLALLHFRAKNYTKSLQVYDEIVAACCSCSIKMARKTRVFYGLTPDPPIGDTVHPKLCSFMDQRAAVYEKLDKLEHSLKDALRVVKIDPLNCKGYLRVGKLHMRGNREKDAYAVYQRGIYTLNRAKEKGISVNEKLFAQLKEQYRGVKGKRKAEVPDTVKRAKKECDPFLKLPIDVLGVVFGMVPLKTLLQCLLVSKLWCETLKKMPSLFLNQFVLRHRVTLPEFYGGCRLMRKIASNTHSKSVSRLSLSSTYNSQHLGRILESIIREDLNLRSLDIVNVDFSLELLYNKIEKIGASSALAKIEDLQISSNCSLKHPLALLAVFPLLQSLETIVVDKLMNGTNSHLIPSEDFLESLLASEIKSSPIKKLALINNEALLPENQKARPSPRTFDPAPPFLNIAFPRLTQLSIVAYDFLNLEAEFGRFLSKSPDLRALQLKANRNLPIKTFLRIIALYEPEFSLDKLVLRECGQKESSWLNDFDTVGFACIQNVASLDLYGSSLTNQGLMKMLGIANNVECLNIGCSQYVQFRKDTFGRGHTLDFRDIFQLTPALRALNVSELGLDNLSLKFFYKDVREVYGDKTFDSLDISHNPDVQGMGLMSLFNCSLREAGTLHVKELKIDGIEISIDTLEALKRLGAVDNVPHSVYVPHTTR